MNRTCSLLTCMDHGTQLGCPHDFGIKSFDFGIKSLGELCGRVLKTAGICKVWKNFGVLKVPWRSRWRSWVGAVWKLEVVFFSAVWSCWVRENQEGKHGILREYISDGYARVEKLILVFPQAGSAYFFPHLFLSFFVPFRKLNAWKLRLKSQKTWFKNI